MIGFSLEYNKKQDLEKKIKLEENAFFMIIFRIFIR